MACLYRVLRVEGSFQLRAELLGAFGLLQGLRLLIDEESAVPLAQVPIHAGYAPANDNVVRYRRYQYHGNGDATYRGENAEQDEQDLQDADAYMTLFLLHRFT